MNKIRLSDFDRALLIVTAIACTLLLFVTIPTFLFTYKLQSNMPTIESAEVVTEPTEYIAPTETTPETIATEPPTEPPTEPETLPEVTEAPVVEETVPEIDPDELEMLACVIYQEAGWDRACDECRRRVGDVVLNRVASEDFPDTMYEVLTQKQAYGRFYWTGIVWPDYSKEPGAEPYVERAYRTAEEILNGQHSDVYGKGYVYQAEFVQGADGFWCCGHYFGRY